METTVDYDVQADDRRAALEVAGGALRAVGLRVTADAQTLTAESGSRTLTVLLGALVPARQEYRRYELAMRDDRTLEFRTADHGPAVSGGPIGSARRRAAWRRATATVEQGLRDAGMLARP